MIDIRDLDSSDLAAVLALNEASEPGVGRVDAIGLEAIVAEAAHARVAVLDGVLVGALVALAPGAAYASPNYRWFARGPESFLYVDRVMVAARARGLGVGRRLYADAILAARRLNLPRLTCEVNEDPPNPGSLAFHAKLGFVKLASTTDPRDDKRVAMLERR